MGDRALSDDPGRGASHGTRADGVRQVVRSDVRARAGASRPRPRRRGRHPDAALDRHLLHLHPDLRVHALLRGQRRAGEGSGDVDGRGRGRDHGDAPAAQLPRQPVPPRGRQPQAGRHGADAPDPGRGVAAGGCAGGCSLRRDGAAVVSDAKRREWTELVAVVLLALAAVATAWSSYQANRWNGEQAKTSARVNATRIEAARASGLANAQTQVDIATFVQWGDAFAQQKTTLADFYEQRFRKEFQPAFRAWRAARPLRNPDAPLTPFAMPEYRLAATATAERLDEEAEVLSAQVRRNIQRSSNYVLSVVLFAVSLFFAGMSAKLSTPRLRVAMLMLGCITFVATLSWVATFPVSVAV